MWSWELTVALARDPGEVPVAAVAVVAPVAPAAVAAVAQGAGRAHPEKTWWTESQLVDRSTKPHVVG